MLSQFILNNFWLLAELGWIIATSIKTFLSCCLNKSYSCSEFFPWVMTPVNSTSRRASTWNQCSFSSGSAHHAPPYISSSFSELCNQSSWAITTNGLYVEYFQIFCITCWDNPSTRYLHVEASPLSCKSMVRLRGSQKLVVLHPVRLQAQWRTIWHSNNTILTLSAKFLRYQNNLCYE